MSGLKNFRNLRFSSKFERPKVLSGHSFMSAFTSCFSSFLFVKNLRFVLGCQSFRTYFELITKVIPVGDLIVWEVLLGCTVLKNNWNSSFDLLVVVTATRSGLDAPNCVVAGLWIKADLLVSWETSVCQSWDRTAVQEEIFSNDVWVCFNSNFITETYLIVCCEKWSFRSLDNIDTAGNCTNGLLSWCYHISLSTTGNSITHITY